jgi:predicted DNA-binding WGR domain protein
LDEAEAKKAAELVKKGKEPTFVPVDQAIKKPEMYEIYYDDQMRPYDCYLTKVDMKNGLYGAFVFYKMQLLHDKIRDLYLLLTRYGRIGEIGMHQQTPFTKIEDALAEYHLVFKQKTSNEWAAALSGDFVKAKKKYQLVEVHYSNVKHKDYLAPFDYDSCKQAVGVCQKVMDFLETVCNVTMYQKAMTQEDVDLDMLPISSLKRDTLMKAEAILKEIDFVITNEKPKMRFKSISFEDIEADYEANSKIIDRLNKLTSEFFEIVPVKEYRN